VLVRRAIVDGKESDERKLGQKEKQGEEGGVEQQQQQRCRCVVVKVGDGRSRLIFRSSYVRGDVTTPSSNLLQNPNDDDDPSDSTSSPSCCAGSSPCTVNRSSPRAVIYNRG
jgi:hypothetical protein